MKHEIKDLIRTDYDTIQDEETVKNAVAKFSKKSHPRTLFVFDKDNKYVGALTQRHIFRSGYQTDDMKIKKLYVNAPSISKDMDIFKVARLMLDSNIRHLPVFEGNTLLGRVRSIDLLLASLESTNISKLSVRKFMSDNPYVANHDDMISKVMHIFQDAAISRIPIIKEGIPVGLVSMHDIITKVRIPNETLNIGDFEGERVAALNLPAENIMNYPLKTLSHNSTIGDSIKMMDEFDMNSVILVDENTKLKGILTKKDLLEPLAAIEMGKTEQKRFIQLRGDVTELDSQDKSEIHNAFEDLLKKYDSHMGEAHAFVYITPHKGKFKKGKTRGVNIFYIRARISSDFGTFVASSEEFGSIHSTHTVIKLLDKQINSTIEKLRHKNSKVKAELDNFNVRATI
jgi:predicted transcriptional regulator